MAKATAIGPSVSNAGSEAIEMKQPYRAVITIRGDSDILFCRWNVEAVAEKAAAAKGSKAKKTDNIESYVYRDEHGFICLPGEYLRGSIVNAARFRQDPRSPRKSAMDLVKAGVVSLTPLASLGMKDWSYEHRGRVVIQRNAITRVRPAINAGWEATIVILVTLPEYITREVLHALAVDAGRLIGVGDFRPTYGRFQVTKFEVLKD
jgi:hypothetical protein